ncbi:N-methylhydantoinase (ATP-hydrolyzing) /5-oxoprolinase [Striga asiatica]|uniref:N-methylhydantoinase (ATP-hydrolyzing) /5-oxoprolinase n=1 Tax=Striga asiatica TaxID=4170 RepID=A0A5A7NYA5_STRAF|nr:N-methylhydantoinase (ATP-hydrolyzing) /5-oxoprolinase [Striga asiatica]
MAVALSMKFSVAVVIFRQDPLYLGGSPAAIVTALSVDGDGIFDGTGGLVCGSGWLGIERGLTAGRVRTATDRRWVAGYGDGGAALGEVRDGGRWLWAGVPPSVAVCVCVCERERERERERETCVHA